MAIDLLVSGQHIKCILRKQVTSQNGQAFRMSKRLAGITDRDTLSPQGINALWNMEDTNLAAVGCALQNGRTRLSSK
jgi:hypothetical protein